MKSIRSRFVTLSLLSILLCTAVVGGIGLVFVARAQEQSSDQILALTCLQEGNKLNQELIHLQASVDSCADLIENNVPSVASLRDPAQVDEYLRSFQRMIDSIARNTTGVSTYYLRFDPALSGYDAGFFYTRKGAQGALELETLTDISRYDPSDTEHVGWFYQPKDAGHALWMDPYLNQNIDVYMVSYVVPLYLEGSFVGVVGMDVDFGVIIDLVREIRPYKTGVAFLASKQGMVYYHPEYAYGDIMVDRTPELADMIAQLPSLEAGEGSGIYTYQMNGVAKKVSGCGLYNGMVLMLSAQTSEINEPVWELMRTVALAGLFIALAAAFAVLRVSEHITKPLSQLTEVAHDIAAGNLDVELPQSDDEVGVLSHSLAVTVGSLKEYISGISDKAYRDALTMVKNAAAYAEATERLQSQIDDGTARFALVMADVNNLKLINDRYGHGRGDEYLCACCQLVCRVFDHSPVYRIGGDEFVVVLEREDYEARDELMVQLEERMAASQGNENLWERVSIACGMAVREPDDLSVETVFRRADQAMYERKREMKAKRRVEDEA